MKNRNRSIIWSILFFSLVIGGSLLTVKAAPANYERDYPENSYVTIGFDETGFTAINLNGIDYFTKTLRLNFTISIPQYISSIGGFEAEAFVSGNTILNRNVIDNFNVTCYVSAWQNGAIYAYVYENYLLSDVNNRNNTLSQPANTNLFQKIGTNLFLCYFQFYIVISKVNYEMPFASSFQFKFDNMVFSGESGITPTSDFMQSIFEMLPMLMVDITIPFAFFIIFNKKPKGFGIGCLVSGMISIFGGNDNSFAVSIGFIVLGLMMLIYTKKRSEDE